MQTWLLAICVLAIRIDGVRLDTPELARRLDRHITARLVEEHVTPAERADEPIVVAPPVAPAPMERPAPMVEVLDSDAGAWERLITLHRAENAGSE